MINKKATNYEEFEAGLLKRPGIRKEYDALKPRYNIIHSIIERRNQLQISQARLAEIVGTKQPAISRLETGAYNTTLSTFFKVANALDLDISLEVRSRDRGACPGPRRRGNAKVALRQIPNPKHQTPNKS
jgi:transcriptional regulator with XRE-family HTH domain